MKATDHKSMPQRLRLFFLTLGIALLFVYVFLPYLTNSFSILKRMSVYLDENGIDPTRYYYTDVEQVEEAEQYLDSVLTPLCSQGAIAPRSEANRFSQLTSKPPDAQN